MQRKQEVLTLGTVRSC